MFGFFSRGFGSLNPNELADFEEALFVRVKEQFVPNFHFLALRLQVAEWCRVGSVGRVGGLPNWWKRKKEEGGAVIHQQRIVGGGFSLPKEAGPASLQLLLKGSPDDLGSVDFRIDETVSQIRLAFSTNLKTYPSVEGLAGVVPVGIRDEREYWEGLATTQAVSQRLSTALLEVLEEHEVEFGGRVVLAACPDEGHLEESRLAGSYRQLLNFSNGIRINRLSIWGVGLPGQRTFENKGREYFYIGELDDDFLVLELVEGETSEEVHKIPHQSETVVATGKNVVEICEHQL